LLISAYKKALTNGYTSDFQLGFRGTPWFCEHLPRVPQLVSKKYK